MSVTKLELFLPKYLISYVTQFTSQQVRNASIISSLKAAPTLKTSLKTDAVLKRGTSVGQSREMSTRKSPARETAKKSRLSYVEQIRSGDINRLGIRRRPHICAKLCWCSAYGRRDMGFGTAEIKVRVV